MSTERLRPNDSYVRPAPLCYSRAATSPAISQSNVGRKNSGVMPGLSIVTCVLVFLLAYSGWSA